MKELSDLIHAVRTNQKLAALAIIGVVILILGVLKPGDEQWLAYSLYGIGLGLLAITVIYALSRKAERAEGSPAGQPVASDRPKWVESESDHGFYVAECRTEIRFLDWRPTYHREVYEKYLTVVPVRNGPIQILSLSGSSSPKGLELEHTHGFEVRPEDQYHKKTVVGIPDARKGVPIDLLEKSTRGQISNTSEQTHDEVRAHPTLETLDIVKPDRWFVVLHVLYPTKLLRFKADLPREHEADVASIRVHQFSRSRPAIPVDEQVRVLGTEEGTLQVLLWEKKEIPADTDFVIHWRWRRVD